MSAWNTTDVAAALPDTNGAPAVAGLEHKNPQEHGWVTKTGYDYETYNKSTKELAEDRAANTENDAPDSAGLAPGEWASNAAVYVWNEEYGEVGPRFPALEEQLFGQEANRCHTGIKFDSIASLDVIQEGTIRLEPCRKFEAAGLHPVMLENVKMAGYEIPTPIQQYCLPAIYKGYDIVACAQTGSGKTAAFLIPILSKLMGKAKKLAANRPNPATFQPGITAPVRAEPLVLVVCPNRELATQIFDEARRFCYRSMLRPCVLYGGGPVAEQVAQLAKGCDVLIGTPGRLKDFIENKPHILTLKRLRYMVIDEADEMLQADWEEEIKSILSGGDQEEGNIVYMMFSATFPKAARDLAKEHLSHDHVRIRVGRAGSSHTNIKQDVIYVEPAAKREALLDLLLSGPPVRTIIFVNSKRAVDELDDFLFNKEMPSTAIHSNRTQREREDSIRAFRIGKSPILIATGVSARGLDIGHVMHVINYDLPSIQYGGIEEYTHRIGRTGRIGNLGLATSFYNDRDADLAETLVKTLLETHQAIPDFLEEHIPEGFTADGQGNVDTLKFDADSDDGDAEGEVNAEASGWDNAEKNAPTEAAPQASGDGWGAPAAPQPAVPQISGDRWGIPSQAAPQPAGWNAAAKTFSPNVSAGGWDAPAAPAVQGPGWDAPVQPVQSVRPAAPVTHAPAPVAPSNNNGWNAPALRAPVQQTPAAPAGNGWGNGGGNSLGAGETTW